MSRHGIGAEGVYFIGISILATIATGIDWLIEGRVSHEFLWWLLSFYACLILAGLHERLDAIRDNTSEIKKQHEDLENRLKRIETSLREDQTEKIGQQIEYVFYSYEHKVELKLEEIIKAFERFERETEPRLQAIEESRVPAEIPRHREFFPELNGVQQGLRRLSKIEREMRDRSKLDEIREKDLIRDVE